MLCSSLLIPGHCHRMLPKKHVELFVFGDSLFDVGNNNYINTTTHYQANFGPYGESFFKYPTGRFSDGRLIPDFIVEYAGLPLVPTFLPPYEDKFIYGVKFASGGAGALVIDLLQDHGEVVEAKTSMLQSDYSKKEFIGMVISNLTTIIKEIYKIGGRKFGFASLGALGCSPRMRALVNGSSGSCSETATSELAKLHNIEFYKAMEELEKQLTGLKYSVHDFYDSGVEVMNNPSRYGFKEAVMACCGSGPYRGISSCWGERGIEEYELCENPGEYLFFDSDHPSKRANKLIAELMWSGTPNVTCPCNLKKLFEHS
ncbi:hypothetical protein Pint_30251 [Pistacia integerrima]|uniref:Uncharacterized protein n=1 Tax=Pistacia integerrima TaxID=434235 RepID=A0ACC0WZL8_9ROSI|nr:hypothetical protein Pint_30251 [Pistacia integerrima]